MVSEKDLVLRRYRRVSGRDSHVLSTSCGGKGGREGWGGGGAVAMQV